MTVTAADQAPTRDPVAEPSSAYLRMMVKWPMIDALRGGTRAIRAAGEKYLPKFSGETKESYAARLKSSFLYPGYRDAVEKIVAKPFGKPMTIENAPTELEHLEDNADGAGYSVTQFFTDVFRSGVHKGICFVVVDMPENHERQVKGRPHFKIYRAPEVLGVKWRFDPQKGEIVVRQVRLQEWATEDDGAYGEVSVSVIRVWNAPTSDDDGAVIDKGTIEVWKKRPDEAVHSLEKKYDHDFDGIPIEAFDPGEVDFFEADPCLEDLAWLNVEHWQSSSDQKSILHYARAYQLIVRGMTDDEQKQVTSFGVAQVWFAKDPQASAQVLEHNGASITAGAADISKIEERMEALGAQVFTQRSGDQTATGKAIDAGRNQSQVQHWVSNLEAVVRRCYLHAAAWMDTELPDDFKVEIFKDFGWTLRRNEDLNFLDKGRARGDISRRLYLTELKKRQLLGEEVDIDAEIELAKSEMEMFQIAPVREGGGDDEAETDDES